MQKKEPEVSDTVWKEFANGDAIEKRREEKEKKLERKKKKDGCSPCRSAQRQLAVCASEIPKSSVVGL